MLNARPVLQEGIVLEPTVVETLPTSFHVDANGQRHPVSRRAFTFLPFSVRVELAQMSAPVYQLGDRQFVWL